MAGLVRPHLGERVRKLREEKGWSQSELAGHLPGVRQQSIDQLERGQVRRPRFLPELAYVLGVSMQWLLTGEGKRASAAEKRQGTGIDPALLRDVFVAVEHVLAGQRRKKASLEQKARLISALYEVMRIEGRRSPKRIAQAASNIVNYEEFLERSRD